MFGWGCGKRAAGDFMSAILFVRASRAMWPLLLLVNLFVNGLDQDTTERE